MSRTLRQGLIYGTVPLLLLASFCLGGWLLGGPEASIPEAHDHPSDTAWTCSMHPHIRRSEAGSCPICGMDLIVAASRERSTEEVVLSEEAKIRARIRTTPVRSRRGSRARRLFGRVEYSESGLREVTAWISGRIDRLHLRTTGAPVRRGQVIATLYSSEVYAAHQDLLAARRQRARLEDASELAQQSAELAANAARDRLRLLGIRGRELQAFEAADAPTERVRIRSPFAGTVVERLATEGRYVETGTPLYRLANLDELWVELDAYTADLPTIAVGQPVEFTVSEFTDETFEGEISFVDPVLDPRTRTAKVRVVLENDGRLRPGMFAEAIVEHDPTEGAETVSIPRSAPLFTGRRSLVYVELPERDEPTYVVREVRLGPLEGEFYPVLAGLREGERVVTEGAFVIDADLQIRGGNSMMNLPDESDDEHPHEDHDEHPHEHPHEDHQHEDHHGERTEHGTEHGAENLSPSASAALSVFYQGVVALQQGLASDDLAVSQAAAATLARDTARLEPLVPASSWDETIRSLGALRHAGTLTDARRAFETVAAASVETLERFGNPSDHTVRVAFCPMAREGKGAQWLQHDTVIENPFFGSAMHSCGDVVLEVAPHGRSEP
ncbi:MAG: efflux RND transporter periplasmic adaptor subunit [Myxococcota bacterium]